MSEAERHNPPPPRRFEHFGVVIVQIGTRSDQEENTFAMREITVGTSLMRESTEQNAREAKNGLIGDFFRSRIAATEHNTEALNARREISDK